RINRIFRIFFTFLPFLMKGRNLNPPAAEKTINNCILLDRIYRISRISSAFRPEREKPNYHVNPVNPVRKNL
ncbi:MAG: hypothetical protein KAX20_00240, partial [Candidatus Omnitrophica bacterium]|nr:hypothetical protein [Candidatus Omnitrophota bacterium]